MKKKYQVFISSTFVDLQTERQAIFNAAIDMGMIPSGMEIFPAGSTEQLRYIKRVIDDCDYYVLVIGGRYGSVTTEGISFTEAEYDYAVEKNKTVLAFIHGDPESFPLKLVDDDPDLRLKLTAFGEKAATGRNVKFWTTPDQLVSQAMTSLHHATEDYPGIGWVRGDFKDNQNVSLEFQQAQGQLWRLQHEVTDLTRQYNSALAAISAIFINKTKPATQAEIEEWIEGAKNNYPNVEQSVRMGRNIRYADLDFILPPLFGASSVAVLVAKGVHVYRVGAERGHSTILYFDGFRMEGI
jgi:Domain of unknown function (DUF4062)